MNGGIDRPKVTAHLANHQNMVFGPPPPPSLTASLTAHPFCIRLIASQRERKVIGGSFACLSAAAAAAAVTVVSLPALSPRTQSILTRKQFCTGWVGPSSQGRRRARGEGRGGRGEDVPCVPYPTYTLLLSHQRCTTSSVSSEGEIHALTTHSIDSNLFCARHSYLGLFLE